jgi:protein SCO1
MSRELRFALFGSVGLVALAAALYASLFTLGVLPRIGFAPGYVLEAAGGQRLTSEDLRGTISLYTFTSVQEQAASRDPNLVMRDLQELLREEDTADIPVRLVTVVLDSPAGDDTAIEAVARGAGAESGRWHVASGDATTLRNVVRDGFGVWYEERAGRLQFDPVFVVVDGMGIIRARHRVGLPEADFLLRDIRSIVREARAASGPARLAYEAAHLFQCYPPR